jgi:predicted DNA-binding protein with PD1-like motif
LQFKLLDDTGLKTWALIFGTNDEPIAEITAFAREHHLGGSQFTGIGAFSAVTLGYYDWQKKSYQRIHIGDQVEVLSLIGDIALQGIDPKVHAHVVVGKEDGTAHGGHLLEAHVRPTLEVILMESPVHLRKRFDPSSGLALISVRGEST